VFGKAIANGAAAVTEPGTHAWGDRVARVRDPFGNIWWLQERVEVVDLEEMGRRFGQPEYLDAMRYTQETLDQALSASHTTTSTES
jgi:PhnB protein